MDSFAAAGEELTFWQLQRRVQAVGESLIGWYEIPLKVRERYPCSWSAVDRRDHQVSRRDASPQTAASPQNIAPHACGVKLTCQ